MTIYFGDGTNVSTAPGSGGATLQTQTGNSQWNATSGKSSFLVFATGGGGGGNRSTPGDDSQGSNAHSAGGGGGGGTGIKMYSGISSATISIGGGGGNQGGNGGNTTFTPNTGQYVRGNGGQGGLNTGEPASGGTTTNSALAIDGDDGAPDSTSNAGTFRRKGGGTFFAGGRGQGGRGGWTQGTSNQAVNGQTGTAGCVMVIEW